MLVQTAINTSRVLPTPLCVYHRLEVVVPGDVESY